MISKDTAQTEEKVPVLFIAGYGRSGSTMLSRVLGQADGFLSNGELRFIWEESFAENQPCGCGQPFLKCPFWGAVIEEAYGGFDQIDLKEIVELKRRVDRMRYIPQAMSSWRNVEYHENLKKYAEILGKLYAAIHKVSGGQVIVDSSKDPSYPYVLANVPNIELRVVHLVRDSRAAAYSWARKRVKHEIPVEDSEAVSHPWFTRKFKFKSEIEDGKKRVYMGQRTPFDSAVGWMRANTLVEPLRTKSTRYKRVRYEDLVANPEMFIPEILALWDGDGQRPPIKAGRTVELTDDHSVAGNPMRFQQGAVELRADYEWKSKMKAADRRTVTVLTWPLLWRYGYLTDGRS